MASRVDSNVNCIKSCFTNVCKSPKELGFVIAIIVGIGGLAVAGVGFASFGSTQGWFAAGALSNLSQIDAIIMMAAGGAGGIVFLIIGIVGTVKNKTFQNKKFTLDMIEGLRIGNYKEESAFPNHRFYLCKFKFTNGQTREVYLHQQEIGNFEEKLGNKCVNNSSTRAFTINRLFDSPERILEKLDGEIAGRATKQWLP
jgi:hypothetical protein